MRTDEKNWQEIRKLVLITLLDSQTIRLFADFWQRCKETFTRLVNKEDNNVTHGKKSGLIYR